MRVLFVTNKISSGGVARVVCSLITGCKKQCSSFECDVVSFEKPDTPTEQKLKTLGVGLFVFPRISRHYFKYVKRFKELLKINHYDAIHTHISYFNWIPCRVAKKAGIKVRIAHAHGQKGRSDSFVSKIIEKRGRKLNMRFSTHRFACSHASGFYDFGCDDFVFLPNFISFSTLKWISQSEINNYNKEFGVLKKHNTILGYMGFLGLQKNPILAIRICEELAKTIPNVVLLVAGEGPEKEMLVRYVHENNLESNVLFLGQRSDNLLLMQYFDCLIMPSFSEGMSIALLESQILGTHCFVSPNVPTTNDVGVGLYHQANSLEVDSFVSLIKKHFEEGFSLKNSFKERVELFCKKGYDEESVIKKLLETYSISENSVHE